MQYAPKELNRPLFATLTSYISRPVRIPGYEYAVAIKTAVVDESLAAAVCLSLYFELSR